MDILTSDLDRAIQAWFRRMERSLRGMQEDGQDDQLRDTLDTLHRQVMAWQTLYEPPPMPPMESMLMKRVPFGARTVGGN